MIFLVYVPSTPQFEKKKKMADIIGDGEFNTTIQELFHYFNGSEVQYLPFHL